MTEARRALVLASASPRRRELLALLGVPFEVLPSGLDEAGTAASPGELAEALALAKALAILPLRPGAAVLGTDTVVALDGRLLGKPADAAEARAMLEALRARSHEVTTGVALVRGERRLVTHITTEVRMRAYADAEIDAYVARVPPGDGPYDKAGAYAIQDSTFAPVDETRGCVCSVIGLPLWPVYRGLRELGLDASPPPPGRCAACPLAS